MYSLVRTIFGMSFCGIITKAGTRANIPHHWEAAYHVLGTFWMCIRSHGMVPLVDRVFGRDLPEIQSAPLYERLTMSAPRSNACRFRTLT